MSVDAPVDHARRIDELVIAEMLRLERIVSIFDTESELERWKRDEVAEPSHDLCELMALGLAWQIDSAGAFNTAAGVVSGAWSAAAAAGSEPSDADLATLAASIAAPRYRIEEDGRPTRTGDCSPLDFNAIAKGWIVDRAVERAMVGDPEMGLVVNAGGDLLHRGEQPVRVGIENPLRPFDNEPPIATIELANAGLATSGRARRGVRIGGRWHSHVVDPQSGRAVDHLASVSVVAADAATADVVATIVGVLEPADALTSATGLDVACLVVDAGGAHHANERWRSLTVGPTHGATGARP